MIKDGDGFAIREGWDDISNQDLNPVSIIIREGWDG